jgi:hypothetical protein
MWKKIAGAARRFLQMCLESDETYYSTVGYDAEEDGQ